MRPGRGRLLRREAVQADSLSTLHGSKLGSSGDSERLKPARLDLLLLDRCSLPAVHSTWSLAELLCVLTGPTFVDQRTRTPSHAALVSVSTPTPPPLDRSAPKVLVDHLEGDVLHLGVARTLSPGLRCRVLDC